MIRPRNWLPLDVEYLNQDTIQELGEAYGPAGPLVFIALIAEARRQAFADARSQQGTVTMRYSALARQAFTGPDVARSVVALAARLRLLDVVDDGSSQFTVFLLKWAKWEPRDVTAAERKRRSRNPE